MAEGLVVPVRVIPRSRSDRVDAPRAGRLVLRVAAPPEAGAANRAAQTLLASALGLREADVRLERGSTSRDKAFSVPTYAQARLSNLSKAESAPRVARRRESLATRGFPGDPVPRPRRGRDTLGGCAEGAIPEPRQAPRRH
ncbi:MAG TPA: DUF167 domain-containing protein [Candidatus Bathyarchaeia archaeon]|nr:DUF167 domain-containing protein [Candidatus Bathyarchaeia archaeon]